VRRLLYDENLGDQTTPNSSQRIARNCDTDQQASGNRAMPSDRAVCSITQHSGSSDSWQRVDDEIQFRKSARIADLTMASRSAIGPKDRTGTKKTTMKLDTGEQQCHAGLTTDQLTSTSKELGSYSEGQPTCKRHVYQKKGGQLDLQHGQVDGLDSHYYLGPASTGRDEEQRQHAAVPDEPERLRGKNLTLSTRQPANANRHERQGDAVRNDKSSVADDERDSNLSRGQMQSESTEHNSNTGYESKEENSGKYEDFYSNYSDVETNSESDSSHVMEVSSGVHRASSGPLEVDSNRDNQRTFGPQKLMVVVAVSTFASKKTIRGTAGMDATATYDGRVHPDSRGTYDEPTTRHEASSHPTS
jgi:hypothetical protein